MCSLEKFNEVADQMESMGKQLDIPIGHQYRFDRESAKRWLVDHNEAYGSDMSLFIDINPPDPNDPQQIHAEIRVFLKETKAILWVKQGRRFNFEAKNLLEDNEQFVHAVSYARLFEQIITRVNRAIGRATIREMKNDRCPSSQPNL